MAHYEWDDEKHSTNLRKHGIGFDEACLIFEDVVLSAVDLRKDYGEIRMISIGVVEKTVCVVVVHTKRDGRQRIISARLANRKERLRYERHLESAAARTGGKG